MTTLFNLFFQFLRVGIFSFGGGYATLPFLYEISDKFHWYTSQQLSTVLAISSVTPGPIGINMATFAGFITEGVIGAIVATCSIILPSLVIVSVVYKVIDKFKTNKHVNGALRTLKPAGCALLSSVGIKLLFTSNLHLVGTIVLVVFIGVSFLKKFDTIFYLGVGSVVGLILGLMHLIGV